MAQGKKYSDRIREQAFALLASGETVAETARRLKLPYSTVKGWKDAWEREEAGDVAKSKKPRKNAYKVTGENLAELRTQNKEQFVRDAWGMIGKAKELLDRRLDRALESEDKLDELMEELLDVDPKELTQAERMAFVKRINDLKIEDVRSISTVLGTLYDKQALAMREPIVQEGECALRKLEDF